MLNTFPNYPLLTPDRQQLWVRIDNFCFDDIIPRLLKENPWNRAYLDRVLLEFKKYTFLCMTSSQPLSPSHQVDIIWHTFLIYTRLYWEDFCPHILGKSLHHTPSRGGLIEKQKYQEMYCYTINYYTQILGEEAPADIWELPGGERKPPSLRLAIFDKFRHQPRSR